VQRDDDGDRQPIADDCEGPCVACVALVDEPADRAVIEVMSPSGKDRPLSAVRTSSADAAAQRGEDHCTRFSVISKTSVAFAGILVGSGVVLPYANSGGTTSRR